MSRNTLGSKIEYLNAMTLLKSRVAYFKVPGARCQKTRLESETQNPDDSNRNQEQGI